MSECRAITNLIGNGVATVVVSRWENEVPAVEVRSRLANAGLSGGAEAPHSKVTRLRAGNCDR
jgi:aerobic C4-dicarboxylate transport protein